MTKESKLLSLANKRKNYKLDTFKKQYNNIGDYHDGAYECNFVSPFSKSANNVNAEIMIFLQDWSSDLSLKGTLCESSRDIGYTPKLPTNRYLEELLNKHLQVKLHNTYATNLFPFIKMGNMSSYIPVSDMKQAALEFGLPQITVVEPKIVICLGLSAFKALRRAIGLKPCKTLAQSISMSFQYKLSTIFCQAHTGQLGRNNRNRSDKDRVDKDWSLMSSSRQFKFKVRQHG